MGFDIKTFHLNATLLKPASIVHREVVKAAACEAKENKRSENVSINGSQYSRSQG